MQDLCLTNDCGEGVELEHDDEDGTVFVVVRAGEGFAEHSAFAWLDAEKAAKVHAWLGEWLARHRR